MNRRHWRRLAALAVAAAALAGCQQRLSGLAPWSIGGDSAGPSAAGAVVVAPGDTAYAISRRYEVPLRDLIELNKLTPPYTLEPGQRLALPSARQYIVQPGDTLYGVSRMFSVDVSELTRLNNLTPPYAIKTGQPLRLPSPAAGYRGGSGGGAGEAAPQVTAAPRSKIERSDNAPGGVSSVPGGAPAASPGFNPAAPSVVYQPGQEPKTLQAGGGSAPVPPSAAAQPVPAPSSGVLTPPRKPAAEPAPAHQDVATNTAPPPTMTSTPADPAPPPPETAAKPAPPPKQQPQQVAARPPAAEAPPPKRQEEAEPPPRSPGRFLTPVKGSIISGFGPKPGGQHNDGLNIAASKGTPVVAADNGVVAYSGNELRGFGNLLLIRHADGWVTAYAHLDRIDVERGAEVKRGQRIGAVGQSGGVPTPQLHFEVRKGSQAVDPKGML